MSLNSFDLEQDVSDSEVEYLTSYVIDSPTGASSRNIFSFVAEADSNTFLVNADGITTTTPLSGAFRHIANYYFSSSAEASIPLAQDNSTTITRLRAIQVGRTTTDDAILSGSVTAVMSFGTVSDLTFIDLPEESVVASVGRRGDLVEKNDNANIVGTIFYDTGTMIFHGGESDTDFTAHPVSAFTFGVGTTAERIAINSLSFKTSNKIKRTSFFCRALNKEFNYTNNITSLKDQVLGTITGSLTGNPTTFITSVGLYNEDGDLLAIAKVSPPVKKNFNTEKTFSVRLQY